MTKVVKKGYLDVKLSRPLFGTAYRRKFVVLVNYSTRGLKAVDVMEDEFSAETAETIEVGEYDRIEVQERQSKSKRKYSFQVTISNEELTFSCDSDEERHHWIQSFIVLKQLAMCETTQPAPPPIPEYFPVVLVKNKHASDIGHSGEYFVSIKDCTIILNWKTTRAIAYQWPRSTVVKFFLSPEKKGQLVLNSSGSEGSTEFVFTTEQESTAKEILGMWNICLLELINTNAEKLNGSSLLSEGSDGRSKHVQRSTSVKTNTKASLMRQRSERNRSHHKNSPPTVPGNHPLPTGGGTLPHSSHSSTPPHPLPVCPNDSSDDDEDGGPDYARIKDKKENPSLDDQLKELELDITRANRAKKKPSTTANGFPTLATDLGSYPKKEPDDYMEPVPSLKSTTMHYNVSLLPPSESDQDSFRVPPAPLPQSFPHVFDNRPMGEPPVPDRNVRKSYTLGEEVIPTIPPRSWRNNSTTSVTSSLPSSNSVGGLSNRSSGVHDDPDSPTTYSGSRSGTQDDIIVMSPPTTNLKRSIIQEESRTNTPNFSEQQRGERHQSTVDGDTFLPSSAITTPPPLPPRSPVKDRPFFPTSSNPSHRCYRCKGLKMAVAKTSSLNESPLCGQDRRQSCCSMLDLNSAAATAVTDGSSRTSLSGLKQAPSSSDGGNCSSCSLGGSSEQISIAGTIPATAVWQQDVSSTWSDPQFKQVAGDPHPSNSNTEPHPSNSNTEPRPYFPTIEPRPSFSGVHTQDVYVEVEAQPSPPNTPYSHEIRRSLSTARRGGASEDRLVPRPNQVPSSEPSQKVQNKISMALKNVQNVEAGLEMLVRKTSSTDLQQSSQRSLVTKTMSIIPSSSPSPGLPRPTQSGQPTVPPRSVVSLTGSPVMTLGRPNFRIPASTIPEGSTVFAHHLDNRPRNPPQAHMV